MTIIKTPNDFFRDAAQFNLNGDTYLRSYPYFIDYFNNVTTITLQEMTIGINFTYGWMPRIFKYKSNNYTRAIQILNNVKIGHFPNDTDLIILKNLFDNSLVGTSKVMHFINPEITPIWDSRVYEYLTAEASYNYRVDNVPNFRSYINFCNILFLDQRFQQAKTTIETMVGYNMSNMRIADLVMYSN